VFRNIVRVFRRYPALAVLAVVVLGIGLGSCFTVFSLFSDLLSIRLPGVHGGPFVCVGVEQPSGPLGGIRWSDFERIRTTINGPLRFTASSFPTAAQVQVHEATEQLDVELVASGYFETLGVRLEAGRGIEMADEGSSTAKVIVIRSDHARRWFGEPAKALGQIVLLNQEPFRVVGVVALPFSGALNSEISLWVPPVAFTPVFVRRPSSKPAVEPHSPVAIPDLGAALWKDADIYYGLVRGEDRINLTETQLMGFVSGPVRELLSSRLQTIPGIDNDPEHHMVLTNWSRLAFILTATLFLVAVLNFSAFFVAQITTRLDEMRVRRNLGARSHHLAMEFMRAPFVLLLLSTLLAVVISFNARSILLKFPPFSTADQILTAPVATYGMGGASPFNWSAAGMMVLLFLLGLAVMGGLPVIELFRVEKRAAGTHSTSSSGPKRIMLAVLACQSALALGSVLSASFLIKHLNDQEKMNPGFDPAHVTAVQMGRGADEQPPELLLDPSGDFPLAVFSGLALRRLATMPGVEASALADAIPLSGNPGYLQISHPNGVRVTAACNSVTQSYFSAIGIRLLEGRSFSTESFAGIPAEAVVNMRLAKILAPNEEILGKTIKGIFQGQSIAVQVVGIADDARYEGLAHPATPMIYLPAAGTAFPAFPMFVVRGNVQASAVASVVRDTFGRHIPGLTVTDSFALADLHARSFRDERLRAALGIGAGCVLLLLAVIGVYGITMFRVAVRRRELAIRMCLGAGIRSIVWTVMREMLVVMIVALGVTALGWNAWDKVLAEHVSGTNLWSFQMWVLGLALWSITILCAVVLPILKIRSIRPAELLKAE
jgi:putative ABC transport system permease protein